MPEIKKRVGIYYWAGPGTVRMIELKYFQPKIDRENLMKSYDLDILREAKNKFGITDAWVTYSWGFSPEREREDYEFLRCKLSNFQQLGIRTHAYVQGTNLVYEDFKDRDFWVRNYKGNLVAYHRGRKLCCPNNPHFRAYLRNRVLEACKLDADGVFIDNFHLGQLPLFLGKNATFFGCNCNYCQALFLHKYGEKIPRLHKTTSVITRKYLEFRKNSMTSLAQELGNIVHSFGKEYGSNSYDVNYDTVLTYGYNLEEISQYQDYVLVENHMHPSRGKSNRAASRLANELDKPVFVVSYKKPIGKQGAFLQRDIDTVFTESQQLRYNPCYKATEFRTRGVWHNLDFFKLLSPRRVEIRVKKKRLIFKKWIPFSGLLTRFMNKVYGPFLECVYEKRRHRILLGWVIDKVMMREHVVS